MSTEDWKNKLYLGDNLDILRRYVADESVDLIYLDPPFNSNATYNILFQEKSGEKSAAQITAFDDTWHWGQESEFAYQEIVRDGPEKLANLIQAFRMFLGQNDMMAYLVMMAERLVELHRVLKPTGSIYLHCDQTASHYLKLLLDAIFGANCFLNNIVWPRTYSSKAQSKSLGRCHDIIFLYSKTNTFTWYHQYVPYDEEYIKKYFKYQDETGRKYLSLSLTQRGDGPPRIFGDKLIKPPSGMHWIWGQERINEAFKAGYIFFTKNGFPRYKRFYDEIENPGKPVSDVWDDIKPLNSWHTELLGYPTQKPESLLERIIKASSNEGDLVLDPFCGCGTSISVAERLHRRWIGIDITHLAITLMRNRLHDTFGNELAPYEIIGQPVDLASAKNLAQKSEHSGRYQFEWWALGLVDARPAQDKKKGADKGIDGYINFFDDNSGKAKTIIVQVKSGHVSSSHIRDLKGVVEREKAQIGVYVTLEEPTKPMKDEAVAAGFYEPEFFPGHYYPKMQILTIQELLDGKKIEYPRYAPEATFKRAQRLKKDNGEEQGKMF
ncbi:MAG: DNA methyltransferase [Dehalococcoidales bacterium]